MIRKLLIGALPLMFAIPALAQQEQDKGKSFIETPRMVENEDEFKPHVGLLLGMSAPEGSYQSSGNFGIESGFQPFIPFGLAVELTRQEYELSGPAADRERLSALVKMTYHFAGSGPLGKTFVGIAPGTIWENDVLYGAIAPLAGIDVPLTQQAKALSLGGQVRYMAVSSDGPDTFDINGVVKYWF